jgi:predicted acetyltransferase
MITLRHYDSSKDRQAVARIWREAGWIEKKEHEEALEAILASGRTFVAELNGEAECMVNCCQGTLRHLKEDIPVSIIGGVTTSRIARRQGLASRLIARSLAEEAAHGKVALLGMFDQGFYDQFGFGSGTYEHWYTLDPADLLVDVKPRVPVRLTVEDWEEIHRCRLARLHCHGSCSLLPAQTTKAELIWSKNGFGLGYRDGKAGELTHHFWVTTEEVEHGPYEVLWMAYQTRDQLYELLGLLKGLADQVHSIRLYNPPGLQLQDLLSHPFRTRRITEDSKHENTIFSAAYWQARILDLPGCLELTKLDCDEVNFNLVLTDPINRFLEEKGKWNGQAGEYIVGLGRECYATPGKDNSLPTLSTSVNAFTRLWLGVSQASALTWADDLTGPQALIESLDAALCLPSPHTDWDF